MGKMTLQLEKEQVDKILGINGESAIDLEIKTWVVNEIVRHYAKDVLNSKAFEAIKKDLEKQAGDLSTEVIREELKYKVKNAEWLWNDKSLKLTDKFKNELKSQVKLELKNIVQTTIKSEISDFISTEIVEFTNQLKNEVKEQLKSELSDGFRDLVAIEKEKLRESILTDIIDNIKK